MQSVENAENGIFAADSQNLMSIFSSERGHSKIKEDLNCKLQPFHYMITRKTEYLTD